MVELGQHSPDTEVALVRASMATMRQLLEDTFIKTETARIRYNSALYIMDRVLDNVTLAQTAMENAKERFRDDINYDGCFYEFFNPVPVSDILTTIDGPPQLNSCIHITRQYFWSCKG